MHLRPASLLASACLLSAFAAIAAWAAPYDVPALVIAGSSRASVTLEVDAGSTGCPAGFAVQYVKSSDLSVAGSWDGASSAGLVHTAQFFGTPTYNTDGTAPSYRLAPYATHEAEMGDLFDETGVSTDVTLELDSGTSYQFRAFAIGDAGGDASAMSATTRGSTMPQTMNCAYTQGYWKNHPASWPVSTIELGSVGYTKSQLLSIFGTPAQGNGLIILAHQLIAARQNIAQGADPSPVSGNLAHADALVGGLVCPPIGSGTLDPATVDLDSQALDDYNNGDTVVPHCGATTPTQRSTWGSIKTL